MNDMKRPPMPEPRNRMRPLAQQRRLSDSPWAATAALAVILVGIALAALAGAATMP